ncbi:MAG: SDR family NAD(P)-dependent oxidoreductase, partial [Actinomycetota bacterium]|nr:SDR family NAD(P)-dependent oxidoreductase [Actinomycetota bacterium]
MAPEVPVYPEGRNLLKGKSVVITAAAGSGIGFATAKRCAEEGARVLLSDLHERRLNEAVETLREEGHDASGKLCDVTNEEQVQSLVN